VYGFPHLWQNSGLKKQVRGSGISAPGRSSIVSLPLKLQYYDFRNFITLSNIDLKGYKQTYKPGKAFIIIIIIIIINF